MLEFLPYFLKTQSSDKVPDPYESVAWSWRTLSDRTEPLEAPVTWSPLAVEIAAGKYFRGAGVPNLGRENSVRQLVYRVAHTIARAGTQQGVFANPKSAQVFENELTFLLLNQMAAFNSPVWFNCGLFAQYGIVGAAGLWHWDKKLGCAVESKNAYEFPQCSACFIQSVDDDLMGIFSLLKNEARIFKYGSGTGTNYSKLRGKQESLSGGGFSSGLMSFLEVFDKAAGATRSGGITRRAAKMVCLDVDHPEILDFIEWKAREEKKAAALVAAGFTAGMDGEAYHAVSGQNSNNSVRISEVFMRALAQNEVWPLRARTDGAVIASPAAKDIWRKLAEAAWACGDPGVQWDATINAWHTCPVSGRIAASNPCSEYMFLDDSACNLASLNLRKFVQKNGEFAIESFRQAIRVVLVAQEILVDHSSYPTAKISENAHRFRPLGLGFSNLGAQLMSMGISYDSEAALSWTAAVTALMTGEAYSVSSELAQALSPFDGFVKNREPMISVIERHSLALKEIPFHSTTESLLSAANESWKRALNLGRSTGFRNAQVTVLAPTGTISLFMDCDTTGIEPEFALVKEKSMVGGNRVRLVNQSVADALRSLGYSEPEAKSILNFLEENSSIENAPGLRPEHLPVFDCAVRNGPFGQRVLAPHAHLRMLAAAQPFVSGAISKTVNLPQDATVEQVEEIFLESYRLKLKSVAIYRDGSKLHQPLAQKVDLDQISCGTVEGCS